MKNHVIISTYAEKTFGKFQHLFLIKPPWRSVFSWLFLRCASLEPLCFLLHVPCLISTAFGNFFIYFIIFSLQMEFSFYLSDFKCHLDTGKVKDLCKI